MMASDIVIKQELRPCTVGDAKALFHHWVEDGEHTLAVVEFEDGSVGRYDAYDIMFKDNKINEYAFDFDFNKQVSDGQREGELLARLKDIDILLDMPDVYTIVMISHQVKEWIRRYSNG